MTVPQYSRHSSRKMASNTFSCALPTVLDTCLPWIARFHPQIFRATTALLSRAHVRAGCFFSWIHARQVITDQPPAADFFCRSGHTAHHLLLVTWSTSRGSPEGTRSKLSSQNSKKLTWISTNPDPDPSQARVRKITPGEKRERRGQGGAIRSPVRNVEVSIQRTAEQPSWRNLVAGAKTSIIL